MNKNLKGFFGENHGLDPKSVASLAKALEKNNLPGFDYIEFKQSLAALASMDMDEGMAYRSAFATAATVGLTKEKLLQTAQHYQNVLTKEKQSFDAAVKKQIETKLGSKYKEVEKLKKQIEDWKKQIAKLEDQIAKSQATIDNADADLSGAKEKIEATKTSFEHTFQSIVNMIKKDTDNINTYL